MQQGAMDNFQGGVSLSCEGIDVVGTHIRYNKQLVSSNVAAACVKQCMVGRKHSDCEQ